MDPDRYLDHPQNLMVLSSAYDTSFHGNLCDPDWTTIVNPDSVARDTPLVNTACKTIYYFLRNLTDKHTTNQQNKNITFQAELLNPI